MLAVAWQDIKRILGLEKSAVAWFTRSLRAIATGFRLGAIGKFASGASIRKRKEDLDHPLIFRRRCACLK